MEQRAWSAAGNPWQWSRRPIQYTPEMCPRSLELIGPRPCISDVSPLFTNEDVEETIDGVNQVLTTLV